MVRSFPEESQLTFDKVPHGAEPTTYNILFVCSGNTCRSPLAAAIAQAAIARRGWQNIAVQSAGTGAAMGMPASEGAVIVAAERDLDLSAHRSQPLTPELVDWADLVLVMGSSHLWAAADMGAGEKVGLITEFMEGDDNGAGIEDPYGADDEAYRATFDQLVVAIEAMLDRLSVIVAPGQP